MYTQDEFCILLASTGFAVLPPAIIHDRENMHTYVPELSIQLTAYLALEIRVHERIAIAELNYIGDKASLPKIPLSCEFNLYEYLLKASTYKVIFTNCRDEIQIDLDSWLTAFKNGYTFYNFKEAVRFDIECSFCFQFSYNLDTSDKFTHKNSVMRIHYESGIDRVDVHFNFSILNNYIRIAALHFTQLKTLEQFMDEYLHGVPVVSTYRRKQIIDNLLEIL